MLSNDGRGICPTKPDTGSFIVTPKNPEICYVCYTKNGVKYTVFHVAYTLVEIALTEFWSKTFGSMKNFKCKIILGPNHFGSQ